jgi:hypothetical protein
VTIIKGKTAMDKHSSLSVSRDGEKSLMTLTTGVNDIKLFSLLLMHKANKLVFACDNN